MPSVSQIATEKILSLIQSGNPLKWKFYQIPPQNLLSKRAYTGCNHFFLMFAPEMKSPYYLTLNQINQQGYKLKKGSKGEFVIFQKLPNAKHDESGNVTGENEGYYMLRYYYVFNAADVEGLELPNLTPAQPKIENFIQNISYVPIEQTASQLAFYNPSEHKVVTPYRERFKSQNDYYSTLFHELAHATAKHFERELSFEVHSPAYKQEELFAETVAVFLCSHFGIETTFNNSAAYIKHYSNGDGKNILSVISAAEKAMQFILSNSEQTKAPE